MPDVGHEAKGGSRRLGYMRLAVEFGIAILLAFIAFTLQRMHDTQTKLDQAVTQLQMTTTRTEAKVDGLLGRLDRLERTQDRQTTP